MENFVPGTRKVFLFLMTMTCFSGDVATKCGSRIRSGIVDEVLEIDEMWSEGLLSFGLCGKTMGL